MYICTRACTNTAIDNSNILCSELDIDKILDFDFEIIHKIKNIILHGL